MLGGDIVAFRYVHCQVKQCRIRNLQRGCEREEGREAGRVAGRVAKGRALRHQVITVALCQKASEIFISPSRSDAFGQWSWSLLSCPFSSTTFSFHTLITRSLYNDESNAEPEPVIALPLRTVARRPRNNIM